MKSLFAKILFWAIGVVVVTSVIFVVAAAIDFQYGSRPQPPVAALISIQMAEAIYAYENAGPDALKETLSRFRKVTGSTSILTDATGRDLVTGKDREDLRELVRRRGFRRGPSGEGPTGRPDFRRGGPRSDDSFWSLLTGSRGPAFFRSSFDGRYTYFVFPERRNLLSWFLQPEVHLTLLLALGVVCWIFARHLTTPVRQLQSAVQRFGAGDLNSRVKSQRRDELGQLARAFDQMADRMVVLLSAERRLLLDISHELRSPLARLSLAVELARSGGDLDKQLSRIQKEADRLNAMLTELLQVTRVEGDESRMRFEPVDIPDLVADIVSDVTIEAEERGTRIEFAPLPRATVHGDAELLRRAIENVVRNAVRYSPEGSPIQITGEALANRIVVSIRDCGPGVPHEDQERIFDAFYRVGSDRDRSSGGVGLGLAIAKRAVQVHRGAIRATNASPGLRVDIELPADLSLSSGTTIASTTVSG